LCLPGRPDLVAERCKEVPRPLCPLTSLIPEFLSLAENPVGMGEERVWRAPLIHALLSQGTSSRAFTRIGQRAERSPGRALQRQLEVIGPQ
jgi:hypothetical protein